MIVRSISGASTEHMANSKQILTHIITTELASPTNAMLTAWVLMPRAEL